MPRFMLMVMPKGYEKAGPDQLPDVKLVEKMTRFNESLVKAGVMLTGEGLYPPAVGTRLTWSGGKARVTDGPFTESKELVGGYWIIQVKSREEAIEWAKRAPMPDGDTIEVRQVRELEDFPPEIQKAAGGSR